MPVKGREVIKVTLQLESGTLNAIIVTAIATRRNNKSLGYSPPVVKIDELLAGRRTSTR